MGDLAILKMSLDIFDCFEGEENRKEVKTSHKVFTF